MMRYGFCENNVHRIWGNRMNPNERASSGGKGIDVPICSEKERKLAWMNDTRIRLFMQREVMSCRDELDWLIRCYHCAANNYPEE